MHKCLGNGCASVVSQAWRLKTSDCLTDSDLYVVRMCICVYDLYVVRMCICVYKCCTFCTIIVLLTVTTC